MESIDCLNFKIQKSRGEASGLLSLARTVLANGFYDVGSGIIV